MQIRHLLTENDLDRVVVYLKFYTGGMFVHYKTIGMWQYKRPFNYGRVTLDVRI